MKKFVQKILNKLNLPEERREKINLFLQTVSYYKLLPYIDFIKDNQNIASEINGLINGKDSWDVVVCLYRYNIKLSIAIYPYIYLLETTIKTQVNNSLSESFGFDWYKNPSVLHRANKNSINYLEENANSYLKEVSMPNLMDFVENNTTLGYWIAIIGSGNFWNSNDIKLRSLFSSNKTVNTATLQLKEINKKLRSVNDLRNSIAHYNQIIGCKIDRKGYSDYKLWNVYQNILELLCLLGCKDIDWMIGDLHCKPEEYCKGNSFEILYKDFECVHQYKIKPQKADSATKLDNIEF